MRISLVLVHGVSAGVYIPRELEVLHPMQKEASNMANVRNPRPNQRWLPSLMFGGDKSLTKQQKGNGRKEQQQYQGCDIKFPLHHSQLRL